MNETQTLEHARLVNAVVSAAALLISHPTDNGDVVLDPHGTRYAKVEAVVREVRDALTVPKAQVELALASALDQGLLDVPTEGAPQIAVRPVTL